MTRPWWAIMWLFSCLLSPRVIHARDQVIKTYHDRSVYTLSEDNVRHYIPDWSTFVALGYDVSNIKTLSDEDMAKIPIGEPASAIVEVPLPDNPMKGCPCLSDAAYSESIEAPKRTPRAQLICLIENRESTEFLRMFDHKLLNIPHKLIPRSAVRVYGTNDTLTATPEMKGCDIVLNLLPSEVLHANGTRSKSLFDKYVCPEMCIPVPYTELPLSWLLMSATGPHSHSHLNPTSAAITAAAGEVASKALTCTMTYRELWQDKELLKHHHSQHSISSPTGGAAAAASRTGTTGAAAATPSSAADGKGHLRNRRRLSASEEEHAHISMGLVLKAMVQRRFEECNEQHLWSPGTVPTPTTPKPIPSRAVHGLILWIGSRTRYELLRSQIEILRNQSSDPTVRIMGWLASEDQYSCRVGSSLCYDANNLNAYFPLMPSTRMNVASAGWSCAQRRMLRALQHTLLLFDPQFVVVADDDTYVNINMLNPGGSLDSYIRTELVSSNRVLGSLTLGKKITNKGFYWGGAGYMFGRATIDILNGFVLSGPKTAFDSIRDEGKTRYLSLLKQTYEQSEKACKSCLTLRDEAKLTSEDGGPMVLDVVGAQGNVTARVIEICTNLMSQEHTCFHSDHAMTRCLLHGANGWPEHSACGGTRIGAAQVNVGMCMGTDYCGPDQLTCHRFYPHPDNALIAKGQYI